MSRIEQLLEGILLEDILDREGIDYKMQHGARGEQINIKECPFCGGSDWKVYANRDEGIGNCFHGSCQQTFNKFKFTRELIGKVSVGDTRKYLENLARDIGWRPKKARETTVEVDTNVGWQLPACIDIPTPDDQSLKYLEDRGINNEMAAKHHLKYCYDGWYKYDKSDGSRGGQNFSGRVIIPVFDLNGDMVTFQGRDITGNAKRKYLFPSGLAGTSSFLYNGQNVVGLSSVIMNEGAFDVYGTQLAISETSDLSDMGVVGSFGINLSWGRENEDQINRFIQLKKTGLKRVFIMWDGEKNAWKKAVDAAVMLSKYGLEIFVCALPPGKDPGEASSSEICRAIRTSRPISRKTAFREKLSTPYS